MKKYRLAFMVFPLMVLCSTLVCAAPVQRIHEIQRPLLNIPGFVKRGSDFSITLKLEAGKKVVSAELAGVTDPASKADLKIGEPKQDGELIKIAATAPENTPVGLYDLKVNFSDGSSDTQPHSVKVIDEFKKDFDFVHLTDIHFNASVLKGKDLNLIRTRLLQDISKQNPEFVLFTGDLGLNPDTYDDDYKYGYEEFIKYLKVPIFMVPGNHEQYIDKRGTAPIDGDLYWVANYGPTYFSFDYGDLHFVGLNSYDWEPKFRDRFDQKTFMGTNLINGHIGKAQGEWLNKDLESASAAGKKSLAFTHIPIGMLLGGTKMGFAPSVKVDGPSTDQFVELMNKYGVSQVFVGHMHFNELKPFAGLTQVMTKASGISGDDIKVFWGYRTVHVKGIKVDNMEIHEIGFKDLK